EVQTGVGRTGDWFFAGSQAGAAVVPDIITLAKALGSGIPVGACLVNEKVAAHVKENDLGTTFGGGMVAMAAIQATLEVVENDNLLANVREVESHLRESLRDCADIVEIHGHGFLLGIEFSDKASSIHAQLLERKIITGTSSNANILRLLPPLCLQKAEVDVFVEALKAVLKG
ncbi:MAG TPA: aminotransferase class III-fold pyridoxal phosphate-dependent enzyme, partial [Chthoniobacterales bacterium]